MDHAHETQTRIVARRIPKRARKAMKDTRGLCTTCGYLNAPDDANCRGCGLSMPEDIVHFREGIYDSEGTTMGEYWLTDREVLQVDTITLSGFLLMALVVSLLIFGFALAGAQVGQSQFGSIVGVTLGIVVMAATISFVSRQTRRLSLPELETRERIRERISWASVRVAVWWKRGRRLTLELSRHEAGVRIGRRRAQPKWRTLELEIHEADFASLHSFLSSTLSGRVRDVGL